MRIAPEKLERFVAEIFVGAGVPREEAARVAHSLVESNLRGHDSHGVVRVWDYVKQLDRGDLKAGVELKILNETDAALATDAQLGFGMVQCDRLIERLVPKAHKQGIACGTMLNSGHVGRLGEWGEVIAAKGLAGFVTCNDNGVLQCVAPPGGTAPRISTNPLSIGVPTENGPAVLDISTSTVANGKVKVALVAGEQCPEGWLQDAEGNPTTDPAVRFSDPRGTILPMGGAAGYKGFGLGLFLDLLVGGLSGGYCPPCPADAPGTNNVLLVMWNPATFGGEAHFQAEVNKLIGYVRETPRKAGVEAIRLPGDRSASVREERNAEGVPLDEGTWDRLVRTAEELGVETPSGERGA